MFNSEIKQLLNLVKKSTEINRQQIDVQNDQNWLIC